MKLKILKTPNTSLVTLVTLDELGATITGDDEQDALKKAKEFFGEDIEIID